MFKSSSTPQTVAADAVTVCKCLWGEWGVLIVPSVARGEILDEDIMRFRTGVFGVNLQIKYWRTFSFRKVGLSCNCKLQNSLVDVFEAKKC